MYTEERFIDMWVLLKPKMMFFLQRRGLTKAEAEDMSQDAMLTTWSRREYFDPTRAHLGWFIWTIFLGKYLNRKRKNNVGKRVVDYNFTYMSTVQSPEQALAAKELYERISRMSEDNQNIILRMLEGSCKGVPSVKKIRAMNELRSFYGISDKRYIDTSVLGRGAGIPRRVRGDVSSELRPEQRGSSGEQQGSESCDLGVV